jgi:hypothetical protein
VSNTPDNTEAPALTGSGFDWGAEVAALGGETPEAPAEAPADGAVEDKTPAETPSGKAEAPKADPPAEVKTDDTDVRRARAMLSAAETKEREAASSLADFKRKLAQAIKEDPQAALRAELGTDLDELIDIHTGMRPGAKPGKVEEKPEKTDADKRLDALEEERRQERAEREQERVNAEVSRIHGVIKADARFPLINADDGAARVTDSMITHFQEHGKPIAWDAAAKLIETELQATVDKLAPLLGYTKGSAKPAPAPASQSLANGATRSAPPVADAKAEDEPKSPDRLIEKLVRDYEREQREQRPNN